MNKLTDLRDADFTLPNTSFETDLIDLGALATIFDPDPEPASPTCSNGAASDSAAFFTPDAENETIQPEDEKRLAGVTESASQPGLLPDDLKLDANSQPSGAVNDSPPEPVSERPGVQALAVVGGIGVVVAAGAGFWFGLLAPRTNRPPEVAQTPEADPPQPSIPPNQEAKLRSRLAFQDQTQEIEQINQRQTPQPEPDLPPQPETTRQAPPEPVVREVAPTPPPPRPAPAAPPTPAPEPAERIDPFARWNRLADLGFQYSTTSMGVATTATLTVSTPEDDAPQPVLVASRSLGSLTIGAPDSAPGVARSDLAQFSSPGAQGILKRRAPPIEIEPVTESTAVNDAPLSQPSPKQVALGSLANGKITIPLAWSEAGSGLNRGRFTLELTEPLRDINEAVALPEGAVIVAEAIGIESESKLIEASAVAIVYRNTQQQIIQEALPTNTILIRGGDGDALIGQALHDPGPNIARQDLLLGTLSALGRIGSILNRPKTSASATTSSSIFSSTIITESREPDVLAAALEGFFTPIAENVRDRSLLAIREALNQPDAVILPQGADASIVVNTRLTVNY